MKWLKQFFQKKKNKIFAKRQFKKDLKLIEETAYQKESLLQAKKRGEHKAKLESDTKLKTLKEKSNKKV